MKQEQNGGSVKQFNEMRNVGKCRYVVNYHDGVKLHKDGSPFYDLSIFSNRRDNDKFVKSLLRDGYEARW